MADAVKNAAAPVGQKTQTEKMQEGRAKARAARVAGPELSNRAKFALNLCLQARKACGMIASDIRAGNEPSTEVLQACSTLSSAAVVSMFDD